MALTKSGFRTLDHIGTTNASVAGSNRALHAYVTDDTAAQVETSDYFLSLNERLKVGDVLIATMAKATTPTVRMYVFNAVSSSTVTISRDTAAVSGDQTAVTLTGADLTDNSAGTPADTIAALADGTTYATDVAAIRSNFASLARAVDRNTADIAAIHAALVASGLLAAS
ncbi:hypothetical protein [Stappia indica]|uniref:Uncharacterized protein n=1 Tax=Stappia indica TaxID=538381 RepID=A0A857C4X4_9HYPH|nr:hypothetical protein [Stappia indica]QGZ33919.1 hypothetical protein GH266_04980 [Stappia indica]